MEIEGCFGMALPDPALLHATELELLVRELHESIA